MFAEGRSQRYSMYQNMVDTTAANEREKNEKRARDTLLLSVKERKQPPRNVKQPLRNVAANTDPLNSDSEDVDSDDSDESYRLSDAMTDQTYSYLHYDTELYSGLDEEEFIQKTKKKD